MTVEGKGKPPKFSAEVHAARPEAERLAQKRLDQKDLLVSLWTPVTVFGAVFLLYVIVVELHTPAYLWLQAPLKAFGLLMLGYFLALIVYRNALRKEARARKLRRELHESLSELDKLLRKHGDAVKPTQRQKLFEAAVAADRARLDPDATALEKALEVLSARADDALKAFKRGGASDVMGGFVKAFAVAMLIRSVFIEPFKIPSGSMIPTLQIGDQVFVNKFIYGVRIPFTNFVPFQIVRAPARGDVIVFNNPRNPSQDYIKRVVGVAGDEIRVEGDDLWVNGVPQPRQLLEADRYYPSQNPDEPGTPWHDRAADVYRERFLDDGEHLVQFDHHPACNPSGRMAFRVPAGNVFVMGDNRNCSSDSRYGLGVPDPDGSYPAAYVPLGNIKGKAMVIWLSLGHRGLFHGLFGGTGFRTDRLFLPVR